MQLAEEPIKDIFGAINGLYARYTRAPGLEIHFHTSSNPHPRSDPHPRPRPRPCPRPRPYLRYGVACSPQIRKEGSHLLRFIMTQLKPSAAARTYQVCRASNPPAPPCAPQHPQSLFPRQTRTRVRAPGSDPLLGVPPPPSPHRGHRTAPLFLRRGGPTHRRRGRATQRGGRGWKRE